MHPLESSGNSLGADFATLKALGGDKPHEQQGLLQKGSIGSRPVSVIDTKKSPEMKVYPEVSMDQQKINGVAEKICKSIAEVNKMQFRGLSANGMDKHAVRREIRSQGEELQHLRLLLHSNNLEDLGDLADNIKEVFGNLTDDEAYEVAVKLQGTKLKLPPSQRERIQNAVLVIPRVLYASVTEAVTALFAGMLGVLWKVNLDPSNPIKDTKRPPVLRVHGLRDTQGSSLPLWLMTRARRKLRNLQGKENIKYGSGYSLSYAGLFYNNPKQSVDDYVDQVADKLISIRKQTGHKQIIMQGHSLGGLIINRFAQLQDALKELKDIPDEDIRRERAKEMRKEFMIEPKIHADFMELAEMSGKSARGKAKVIEKLSNKLEQKGLNIEDATEKMEKVLEEKNPEERNKLVQELADEAADAWWVVLQDKIDPDHEDIEKRSMEAKWLISICTPYDGSKIAKRLSTVQNTVRIPPPRIVDHLKKRSEMSKIIGENTREKVSLGKRNVYNIACKTTDEFVSEGSATVNYDYRFTKVIKSLGHLGVLFSPRVAKSIGGWLDDIYIEAGKLADEKNEA